VIVGAFVLTWVVALLYWRLANVEEKWDAKMLGSEGSETALAR